MQTGTNDLTAANAAFARRYPGERPDRQPVHTVYGGAHLFAADTAAKLGTKALAALEHYAPDAATFARAVGLPDDASLIRSVYERVRAKLAAEPVEDFRIDFEDGYGVRPDTEEDEHARAAADAVAEGAEAGTLPPFIGIRVKPLTNECASRALRTLEHFVTRLAERTGGNLPDNLTVTLPKVTVPEQVAALADALDRLGLDDSAVSIEIMVETTQSIIGPRGDCPLLAMVEAGRGRTRGAHFGTYDYTASCGITAAHQIMMHSACDFARHTMQVALSGTGVWLSDGATNVLPVPVHRGDVLSNEERDANVRVVHGAWRRHFVDVGHSLRHAFYQGWDLHPAQLCTRYAAVYAFFLEALQPASERMRGFVAQAARATLVGDVFDDAATGQGLLNFFLRGLNCGAITGDEAQATGLTLDELRGRSFAAIVEARRG